MCSTAAADTGKRRSSLFVDLELGSAKNAGADEDPLIDDGYIWDAGTMLWLDAQTNTCRSVDGKLFKLCEKKLCLLEVDDSGSLLSGGEVRPYWEWDSHSKMYYNGATGIFLNPDTVQHFAYAGKSLLVEINEAGERKLGGETVRVNDSVESRSSRSSAPSEGSNRLSGSSTASEHCQPHRRITKKVWRWTRSLSRAFTLQSKTRGACGR